MSVEPFYMLKLAAYEAKELLALEAEQITHPLADYLPGSERLERLYLAMDLAQRFQQPSQYTENV
jgi:hypothetical protein